MSASSLFISLWGCLLVWVVVDVRFARHNIRITSFLVLLFVSKGCIDHVYGLCLMVACALFPEDTLLLTGLTRWLVNLPLAFCYCFVFLRGLNTLFRYICLLSACLYVYLFICLSHFPSLIHFFLSLFLNVSMYLFICLSIYLFISLSI